jgi:hypothetical protein
MPEFAVKKLGHRVLVNVIDGVPQCSCCQEPMVRHGDGWMCAVGAAVLEGLEPTMTALDQTLLGASTHTAPPTAGSDDGE